MTAGGARWLARIVACASLLSELALGCEGGGGPPPLRRRHVESEAPEVPTPASFEREVAEDLRLFGLEETPAVLHAPQRHRRLVDEPLVLGAGGGWSNGPLRVRVTEERVTYKKHGARVTANHTIAILRNIGKVPVGYRLRIVSSDRGKCPVRGSRTHNAMALMPREEAQVVVCAGSGKVRLESLEVLEISELGYHYLSKVPPQAVGYDDVTMSAHTPPRRASRCRRLEGLALSGRIQDGRTRWVDVADFFSRHNCDRYAFAPDYHYSADAREVLPAPDAARHSP